jgi:phospholipase/lecithinase/hemolysin
MRFSKGISAARSVRVSLWLVMALLAARTLTLQARAGFSSMYVFGDSLSAVSGGGTQYPPPPGISADNYWNGRFSNGQVWVEYLAALQGITFNTNNDYSNFGDATSEVYYNMIYGNYYPPPDLATSLCVYWSACSDCFMLALFVGTNSWAADIPDAMSDLNASVGLLYTQGMRTLLLPNSVDISLTPFFTHTMSELGVFPTNGLQSLLASLQTNVIQYNADLAAAIGQMRAQYPGLTIYAADFYTEFNSFISQAGAYGVTTTNIDALEDPALEDKSFNGPGANYLFWDYLHPTTKVHSFVANYAQQLITPARIRRFSSQGANIELDLENLPIGRVGALESKTNLMTQPNWTAHASILVTNSTQTVFVSTNGLGGGRFFRLNFPP